MEVKDIYIESSPFSQFLFSLEIPQCKSGRIHLPGSTTSH